MTAEDVARRKSAKLNNERLKLIAAFCNTLGVATFVAFVIAPTASGMAIRFTQIVFAMSVAFVLHVVGQGFLWLWRSED